MPHHRAKHPRPGLLILRCLWCQSEPITQTEPFDIFNPGPLPQCIPCRKTLSIVTRVLDNIPKVSPYRFRKNPPRKIVRKKELWQPRLDTSWNTAPTMDSGGHARGSTAPSETPAEPRNPASETESSVSSPPTKSSKSSSPKETPNDPHAI